MARQGRGLAAALVLAALPLLLAACDAVVVVNATANVPPQYLRVLVTVEQLWLHQDPDAPLEDEDWEKHRLDEPRTIDLARLAGSSFVPLAGEFTVDPGTYRQLRLFLADTHGRLRDSAEELGASYNNEVTWIDEDGDLRTAPLEILDPGRGIGMTLELDAREALVAFSGASQDNIVQVVFDAARDLTQFRYGRERGFLLDSTLRAHAPDNQDTGAIAGMLDLSQVVAGTLAGRPDIQVTAQRLDAAAGRRVVVASTAVARTGQFVLYPLPLDEGKRTTEYDLVVHGPGIQTVIIKEIPVRKGGLGAAPQLALSLQRADSFEANVASTSSVAPAGARVGFYQTPPGENEPFLVGMATVDPFSGRFVEPVRLSRATTIQHGTWSSSNLDLRTSTPKEGAARYAVAAFSPHFGHGEFAAETLRPPAQLSGVASFSVPPVSVIAPPALPGLVSATVIVETPGRHDRGALLVTHEGALVALAPLDELLQQQVGSAFVDVSPVPAGSEATPLRRGLYSLGAWTWNSSDEEDTFRRHAGAAPVDLRSSAQGAGELRIR